MPRGKNNPNTNKSWGTSAYHCFKRIEEAQNAGMSYFVYTGSRGKTRDYEIKPDEKLVILFDYNKAGSSKAEKVEALLNKKYRVSDKGNVFSIRKKKGLSGEPDDTSKYEVYKMKPDEKTEKGYETVGDSWQLNRIIWFSFAADAILNNKKMPPMYGIPAQEREVKDLKGLKALLKYEVDHESRDTKNNSLERLRLMPQKENLRLVKIDRAQTDEEVVRALSDIEEITVAVPGTDGRSHKIFNPDENPLPEEISSSIKDRRDAYIFDLLYKAFSAAYVINPERLRGNQYGEMIDGEKTILFRVSTDSEDLKIKKLDEIPKGEKVTIRFDVNRPTEIFI